MALDSEFMGIVRLAENAVRNILDSFPDDFAFHDFTHSKQVQDAVIVLGRMEGLDEDEIEILEIAALFHDAGYGLGAIDHELRGAQLAEDFLKAENKSQFIKQVRALILSTKVNKSPDSSLGKVLCDADLSYLGSELYHPRASLLRHEMYCTRKRSFSELDWLKFNLDFFKKHHFLTSSARVLLGPKKDFNQLELENRVKELESDSANEKA